MKNPSGIKRAQYLIKNILFFLAVLTVFSGCFSSRKIDKWVAKQYQEVPASPKKRTSNLSIQSNLPESGQKISVTKRENGKFLPLIFYWRWESQNHCYLNPKIAEVNIMKTLDRQSGKTIKEKIGDGRLELTIEKAPDDFIFKYQGSVIYIILYAFTQSRYAILPSNDEIIISFRSFGKEGQPLKTGRVSVSHPNKGVDYKFYQSIKKRMWQYLKDRDETITTMSREIMDKLALEL